MTLSGVRHPFSFRGYSYQFFGFARRTLYRSKQQEINSKTHTLMPPYMS